MTINIERHSGETSVSLALHPVPGKINIDTPSGFLGHMLELMAHNAGWGLSLKASGDADVDFHHLVEDTGIVLGMALLEWYPSSPRNRYGWCAMPMDGSLVMVAVDLSGRGGSVFRGNFPSSSCGSFDMELVPEFFRAFAREARITIHIRILESDNSHHTSEAIFKGFGRSLAQALAPGEVSPSTKGIWP